MIKVRVALFTILVLFGCLGTQNVMASTVNITDVDALSITVECNNVPPGYRCYLDYGDGSGRQDSRSHTYDTPGRYSVRALDCTGVLATRCITSAVITYAVVIDRSTVAYRAHVAGTGWQGWRHHGEVAGTTGQSRQMEAVQLIINPEDPTITPAGTKLDIRLTYRAHVAGIGWQGYRHDGEAAGTTGQSRRMEAIRVWANGSNSNRVDVWYRAHVSGYGWLGWVKNGAVAGTTGQSRRMEALEVQILPR